jgi:hypothetical protein
MLNCGNNFRADLRKAFDLVWRNGLFSKLQSSGIGSKTIIIIRGIHTDTKFSLKRTEGIADYFTINRLYQNS